MKNILVIDPSIMIHKIVQLAFPENEYKLFLSSTHPPEISPEEPLSLVLLSADLPNHEDVFAMGNELKQNYNCPVLMMIPKFFEYDSSVVEQNGLDGTIEKPFTSDTLKEKYRAIESASAGMDELDSLSPEELESITEEEFMLSEEDLLDIGEEDLADIEIPDSPPEIEEPETEDISDIPTGEGISEQVESVEEEAAVSREPVQVEEEQTAPFEDMEMDEDLDSIDFGDLEDGESLLDEPMPLESDSLSEEETVSTTEEKLAETSEEKESTIPEVSETAFAGESDKEEADFDDMTEELLPEAEGNEGETEEPLLDSDGNDGDFDLELTDAEDKELPEVGHQTIREAVRFEGETEIPSPEPEQVLEEAERLSSIAPEPEQIPEEAEEEPLNYLLAEEKNIPKTDSEPVVDSQEKEEVAEEDLPDVNFAIEEEPQTVQVDEYEMDGPLVKEEVTPLDISHADEDVELIPAPSALSTEGLGISSRLTEADIQTIAERVVAMLSDKAIRDIAWEVIPVVAEEIVRGRIRQLENEEVE